MDVIYFMSQAIIEAKKAKAIDEVPIGCVIVFKNEIIGRGYNKRNSMKNALCHAEISAIDEACKFIGDWRLEDCTLFVTIEPCPMCAGAIIQARIKQVVFGTKNKKAGCAGSVLNILDEKSFNHQAEITEGVLQGECMLLMKDFFADMRKKHIPAD